MNERIKELAERAETYADEKNGAFRGEMFMRCFTEKFYELVRQDEREANVKLLEDFAKTNMVPAKDTWRMGLIAGANAIRSKHD